LHIFINRHHQHMVVQGWIFHNVVQNLGN
jgi:hypothetical protein